MTIQERLFALQDTAYAAFQGKLTPTIPQESIIGVRVPELRKLAKALVKEAKEDESAKEEMEQFLHTLPHTYYDENLLHGMLISEMKDFDQCLEAMEAFLPYIDNWAVSDTTSPKALGKKKDRLMEKILEWTASSHTYTCRFGVLSLMRWFLDQDFQKEYLEIPAKVRSEEYYVRMMTSWFFATALTKQWDASIPYIEEKRLEPWTHNKTIQKAIESYRITDERKQYLRTLKIK